jgi:acetyl esterase/lipase
MRPMPFSHFYILLQSKCCHWFVLLIGWNVWCGCALSQETLPPSQVELHSSTKPSETTRPLDKFRNRRLSEDLNRESFEIEKEGGLVYSSSPGWNLKLDIYRPVGAGPFPAVVMLHGGAWAWGSKFNWQFHARRLARQGFVVIPVNYRKAPWHPFPAQWIDCRNAVRWVRANAEELKIDPQQICAFGYSAGGHLALMLLGDCSLEEVSMIPAELQTVSPHVQAIVAGGSPCDFDWLTEDSFALWYWLRASKRTNPRIFELASPLANCNSQLATPVFLYHGETDEVVSVESTRRLHQRRVELGLPTELVVLPDCGHYRGFVNLKIVDQAADFFRKNLSVTEVRGQSNKDASAKPQK